MIRQRRRLLSTVVIAAMAAALLTTGTAYAAEPYHEETAVFTANTEGHFCYRIPAIVKAANGDLLAFAEGRVDNCNDRGNIDLVLKRSHDGGRTWGPLQIVSRGNGDTHGNPMPVVDERTGRVVLFTTHNPGTGTGGRVPYLQVSDDNGATWTAPREMTELLRPEWTSWYATGPGHAIQLTRGPHAGRLVISANHEGGTPSPGILLAYSDDDGNTWQMGADGGGATPDIAVNESSLVELTDGRIYVNVREGGTALGTRAYAISSDGGESYDAPFQMVPELTMPVVQGSMVRLDATDQGDAGNRILFAGPANPGKREALTIRSSFDEAQSWQTWQQGKVISWGPGGYSDLVKIGNDPVEGPVAGVLYEGGTVALYEVIEFVRFNEAYLDTPNGTPPNLPPPPAPGPTTPDASPRYDNTAYVRGGATLTDGRFGDGLAFDGVDDRVEVPYNSDVDLGDGDFTIMTWFRYSATTGQHTLWWFYQWGTGAAQIWLRAYPVNNRIQAVVGTGQGDANITIQGAYNDGLWHHVAMRRTATRVQVLIDGATVADVAAPRGSVTTGKEFGIQSIILGQRIDQTNVDPFHGTLDEFRVYGRALSDEELREIRQHNVPIAGQLRLRLPFTTIKPQQ
ncbi:sialidase family protein [Rugosimonospora africana]|uniref:exo-alpha-sialidase n=1 Tax=Rugosimonospora africana TaxID=556532 RepID=A0A8J3QRD6_9ACTN|nr:sialidase family protein [Rugosimonospora africana]GIH14897.1 neuramidase [Rugosimonospora africana]